MVGSFYPRSDMPVITPDTIAALGLPGSIILIMAWVIIRGKGDDSPSDDVRRAISDLSQRVAKIEGYLNRGRD